MSQNKGFRHFRNLVPLVQGQDPGLHQIHNKGGVTMAFESPKHINDLTDEDKVTISFAFCSSDDNFERKTGRAEAERRLTEALAIPGDQFQRLLHAPIARDLLISDILPGLDEEQSRNFRSRVKRSLTRVRAR